MMSGIRRIDEQRTGRRLNVPLTRLISFGFGGFVALAIALVLFLSVKANFQNTFSLLNDKAILITQAMDRQLRDHFQSFEKAVADLKPMFDKGRVPLEDVDQALAMMEVAMATNNRITVLVVSFANHDSFGVYKAPDGKLWPFKREIPEGGRETYTLPQLTAHSGPTWGKLQHSELGQFANVSVPIVIDGEMVATLTAAGSLKELGDRIHSLDEGEDSTTFIFADGDQVVVHSDMAVFQTGDVTQQELPVVRSELGDPVLMALGTEERLEAFQKAADLGIRVSVVETTNDDFIVMRMMIPGFSEEPWVIGQYFRGATTSREVRRLTGSAMVGAGALVIAVLIAIWLGRRVARPLKVLARQSERVGGLALDDVEPLPRSRVAELDQVAVAFNSMVEGLKAMNTYVPRSLFAKLMRLGGQDAALAREAELTVFFTDIAGFTSISEHMSASQTAEYLNRHFAVLVDAVEAEGGTVDKFIGDGMLAFWGAPDNRPDHAAAAVRAGRRIATALKVFNDREEQEGHKRLQLRIGIHTGQAVVGNVGALDRWNYTVVGDTVNVSERLQTLGREFAGGADVVILASAETMAHLPTEAGKIWAGEFSLRGRSKPLEVWKLDLQAAEQPEYLEVSPSAAE